MAWDSLMQRGPMIPSLYSDDMEATLSFYSQTLGFGRTGEWIEAGELKWMELKRLDLSMTPLTIWFFGNPLTGQTAPVASGLFYFLIDDVDGLAAQLKGKVDFDWGPEMQPYGLCELGLKDNNGYYLVFAQETD